MYIINLHHNIKQREDFFRRQQIKWEVVALNEDIFILSHNSTLQSGCQRRRKGISISCGKAVSSRHVNMTFHESQPIHWRQIIFFLIHHIQTFPHHTIPSAAHFPIFPSNSLFIFSHEC